MIAFFLALAETHRLSELLTADRKLIGAVTRDTAFSGTRVMLEDWRPDDD